MLTRRQLVGLGAGLLALHVLPGKAAAKSAKVVVLGGGFAGATTALHLKKMAPEIQVTLVEPKKSYFTCPTSNWVIAGQRDLKDLEQGYAGLKAAGVEVIHATASRLKAEKQQVTVGGKAISYDRLVVAPGISFRWNVIEGNNPRTENLAPHAWQAGEQTLLLRRQLEAMPDGGIVAMSVPALPYRCPPGPYERASLIAHYLKQHKPKSKILILDAKDQFAKQAAFVRGWTERYGYGTPNSLIEWVPGNKGGKVIRIDAQQKTAYGEVDVFNADVLNVIPPQQAGLLVRSLELTDDTGFCPVQPTTFESTLVPKVHVVGDAAKADPMPKSAHAANAEGKVCAAALVSLLRGETPPDPHWVNTCYSLVDPSYGISVVGLYKIKDNAIYAIGGSGGISGEKISRTWEATYAENWYKQILQDSFAVG